MSSIKFVVSSLDTIAASRDAQRSKPLGEGVQRALAAVKESDPQLPDPEIIFAPLRLATQSGNIQLTTTALDCIGQLISYSYFTVSSPPQPPTPTNPDGTPQEAPEPPPPLIERAIETICDCFQGEGTPVEIQVQIVRSLLAAVLNDKIVVHGAGLLKAIRQVYNVFLLSRNTANQHMAQGTLTQMVGTVFERVKARLHLKESRLSLSKLKNSMSNVALERSESEMENATAATLDGSESPETAPASLVADQTEGTGQKLTLKDMETNKSFDDSNIGDGPTMVTQIKPSKRAAARSVSGSTPIDGPQDDSDGLDADAEDQVYIRDAYLVFRSFCNLSTKVLPPDLLYDLRGQPMRSKLISLHLTHTILNNHIAVFTSPLCTITNPKSNDSSHFLQAIKYYLCLSITRNGASSVDRVFEVCCEMFWLMWNFMRAPLKVRWSLFLLVATYWATY